MKDQLTTATCFFSWEQAMLELKNLEFAVSSMLILFSKGSHEFEIASNVKRGIRSRIDYLYDSFNASVETEISRRVAKKLVPHKDLSE